MPCSCKVHITITNLHHFNITSAHLHHLNQLPPLPPPHPPQDSSGVWYGLRPSDVTDVTFKQGKCCVLALDPYQADNLLDLAEARIIAVWVTLNTAQELKDRYR